MPNLLFVVLIEKNDFYRLGDECRRHTKSKIQYTVHLHTNSICFTVICPRLWKLFWLLSVTDVVASLLFLVGWFITLISTLMSPPVQSWHSTKTFSAVPTRNKLGAVITCLQSSGERERETVSIHQTALLLRMNWLTNLGLFFYCKAL